MNEDFSRRQNRTHTETNSCEERRRNYQRSNNHLSILPFNDNNNDLHSVPFVNVPSHLACKNVLSTPCYDFENVPSSPQSINEYSSSCSSNCNEEHPLEEMNTEKRSRRAVDFSFGITNARSLWHKIDSLVDFFTELELSFAVVTETWFHTGEKLHGLQSIDKCRTRSASSNPGGGVSIVHNPARISLKPYPCKTKGFEIVSAVGKVPHNIRPTYILGIYVSTKLRAEEYHNLLDTVNQIILRIKMTSRAQRLINLKIPVLVRSLKSSNVELG